MHFLPLAKYWIDAHCHIEDLDKEELATIIEGMYNRLEYFKIKRQISILPMKEFQIDGFLDKPFDIKNNSLLMYLEYKNPDISLMEKGIKAGICGIKLHNAYMIMDGADHTLWLTDEWKAVFAFLEKNRLPILWHVTQRLTDSPYTNGSRNMYWRKGWKKGVVYTNEDLLGIFLKIVESYPGINFIAAHQLHLGWERLSGLFDKYENLYTDTSIGCFVRQEDCIYDFDRDYLREYFIKYSKRILFGTDLIISKRSSDDEIKNIYRGHISFIKQLRLPSDALQSISHENALSLFITHTGI
jgi:predicted TIM-barrel fold metal-dependent hydrolase